MSPVNYEVKDTPDKFLADPGAWLAGESKPDMDLLLAHADDGVIWGRVVDGAMHVAGDAHPTKVAVRLDPSTLQQARLFGPGGELLLWRTDTGGFQYRVIADGPKQPEDTLPDSQLLWGTPESPHGGEPAEVDGFTLLMEGRQGLRHAPPISNVTSTGRVRLTVRHYVSYDMDDVAYIADSRLTGLEKLEKTEGA